MLLCILARTFIIRTSQHVFSSIFVLVENKILTKDFHIWLQIVVANHFMRVHDTHIHS